MKTKTKKILSLIMILLFTTGLVSVLVVLFGPKTQAFAPHYLFYQGNESKIYAVSEISSYTMPIQTNPLISGQEVPSGMGLFIITLNLRNDYTKENPPPSTDGPVTPIDGTAYICLRGTLKYYDVSAGTVNLTPSDFSTPSADQTGIVLASGQTATVQLYLATGIPDKITSFAVILDFVGDTIPR